MTVTPVANCPRAKRNSDEVMRVEFIAEVSEDIIVAATRKGEIHGANDCNFRRNRARRIGAGEPLCARGRTRGDWITRGATRSGIGPAATGEDWRRRTHRGSGQYRGCCAVRDRGADAAL